MDTFRIKNSDHVVVYGREGCLFTPRTYFLFRTMGHDLSKIHLLQGPLEKWIEMGGDVDEETLTTLLPRAADMDILSPTRYEASEPCHVCDMDDVRRYLDTGDSHVLLDSRGSSFKKKGHIPGAVHVPYSSLMEKDDPLSFLDKKGLKRVFEEAGVDVATEKRIVCSCGSGVSVCHLFLALELCGRDAADTVIYDGSWAEWGNEDSSPKVLPE